MADERGRGVTFELTLAHLVRHRPVGGPRGRRAQKPLRGRGTEAEAAARDREHRVHVGQGAVLVVRHGEPDLLAHLVEGRASGGVVVPTVIHQSLEGIEDLKWEHDFPFFACVCMHVRQVVAVLANVPAQ